VTIDSVPGEARAFAEKAATPQRPKRWFRKTIIVKGETGKPPKLFTENRRISGFPLQDIHPIEASEKVGVAEGTSK
jgi:hypothetical protein